MSFIGDHDVILSSLTDINPDSLEVTFPQPVQRPDNNPPMTPTLALIFSLVKLQG